MAIMVPMPRAVASRALYAASVVAFVSGLATSSPLNFVARNSSFERSPWPRRQPASVLFRSQIGTHWAMLPRRRTSTSSIGILLRGVLPRDESSRAWFEYGDLVRQALRGRFRRGDYYVWRYADGGTTSSYERYEVTDVTAAAVQIEMATLFPQDDDGDDDARCDGSRVVDDWDKYNVHHRMTVVLSENLAAIGSKDDWRLRSFEYRERRVGGSPRRGWRSATPRGEGGKNVQAFEEKFDVHAMADPTPAPFETRPCHLDGSAGRAMRTERHWYTGAWYGAGGPLRGVALFKEFDERFSFSLIAYGNGRRRGPVGVEVRGLESSNDDLSEAI